MERKSLMLALLGLMILLFAGAAVQENPEIPSLVLAQDAFLTLSISPNAPEGEITHFSLPQLESGLLLYVSAEHPLRQDFSTQQARNVRAMIGQYLPVEESVSLSEETIYALCALRQENLLCASRIVAGMRAPLAQESLQKEAFAQYLQTLPVEAALQKARQDVPDSGQSEHQLSTAFDVQLTGAQDWSQSDPMARNADGIWLLENGWRFGFIRRYPPEKSAITGVTSEQNHWRYVGKAHAAILHMTGWCLEEYLQALHRYGALRLENAGGEVLWVVCAAIQENGVTIAVPAECMATPSADNMGYAICVLAGESFSFSEES